MLAFPTLSHAEQAGSFPSHLILAVRHLEQAATGRLTLRSGLSRNEVADMLIIHNLYVVLEMERY